jgi:hypothetical protein
VNAVQVALYCQTYLPTIASVCELNGHRVSMSTAIKRSSLHINPARFLATGHSLRFAGPGLRPNPLEHPFALFEPDTVLLGPPCEAVIAAMQYAPGV